ncbi:unnamed protein product [Rotaria sp. Silwood1]|nr:unnamed protein product [Rotaria sp. Silwood1]CAF1635388.1 unnamed protein product [Rotaria sp. Silwood1]
MTILIHLKFLPCLFSLRIDLKHDYANHFSEIYQMIFYLPFLKYNKLSILTERKPNISIPIDMYEQLSTIEYLVLSHICDLSELTSILRHTPQLKRLTCQRHWECLLSQHMPYLFRFILKYEMFIKDVILSHTSINQFNSQFWFQRGWNFRLDIKPDKIFYLIYPIEKTFFISYNHHFIQHTISSMQFSSPIDLSITNYSSVSWEPSFIETLRLIIYDIPFKSLHLFWSGMSYCTLDVDEEYEEAAVKKRYLGIVKNKRKVRRLND